MFSAHKSTKLSGTAQVETPWWCLGSSWFQETGASLTSGLGLDTLGAFLSLTIPQDQLVPHALFPSLWLSCRPLLPFLYIAATSYAALWVLFSQKHGHRGGYCHLSFSLFGPQVAHTPTILLQGLHSGSGRETSRAHMQEPQAAKKLPEISKSPLLIGRFLLPST